MKTKGQKRGEYTRKRRKKFLYLKHTGQYENYLQQKREIKEKKEIKKVADNNNLNKIMANETKKLLWLFPADKLYSRVLRRGIIAAVLTLLSIIIKEGLVPTAPEAWTAVLAGILMLLDKGLRELIAGSNEEVARQ